MEVTKANLATYLAGLTASATPYPIEITETVASDWGGSDTTGTIGNIINSNTQSGVYLDLGLTIIPSSVTVMSDTFLSCTALKTAPVIPNSVTNMSSTFYNCTALTTAPVIPNSVTSIVGTFDGCTSLTTAPAIPNSVTNMYETFYGCTVLTTVPIIPSNVTNMEATFYGCTSLHTIQNFSVDVDNCNMINAFYNCPALANIYVTTLSESSWHLLHTDTDATGTDYTIYNPDGTVAGSGTVAGTSQVLSLYGKSDELVISANITPTLAVETATSQVQWHKSGLPYDDELMIFNAKNPTTVISNVLITTIRKNANFTLDAYADGQKIRIANTHATNTITCTLPTGQTYAGAVASFTLKPYEKIEIELFGTTWEEVGNEGIGTITATGSATADFGRLLCHGQALSRTTYARLFNRIGIAFGVGNGTTTFNLPDCREVSLVGAGTNELNASAIRAHDTYTVGQFKDDAFEKHSHSIYRDTGGYYAECRSVPSGLTDDWYAGTGFNTLNAGSSATTHGKQLGINYQIKY